MPSEAEIEAGATAQAEFFGKDRDLEVPPYLLNETIARAVLEAAEAVRAVSPPEEPAEPECWCTTGWDLGLAEYADTIAEWHPDCPRHSPAVAPPEEPAEGRVWMDGQWWQVEQFNDRGDLLFVDRGSHRPEYRSAKWANDRYEPVYRLVPVSQEPPK